MTVRERMCGVARPERMGYDTVETMSAGIDTMCQTKMTSVTGGGAYGFHASNPQ